MKLHLPLILLTFCLNSVLARSEQVSSPFDSPSSQGEPYIEINDQNKELVEERELSARGGAIDSEETVAFRNVDDYVSISSNLLGGINTYANPGEETTSSLYGGALYSRGDIVLDDVGGSVRISDNRITLEQQLSFSSHVEAMGGALYAGDAVSMSNINNSLELSRNSITLTLNNDYEAPSSVSIIAQGGAIRSQNDVTLSLIASDDFAAMQMEGNTIQVTMDTPYFDVFAAGGVVSAEGSFSLSEVTGDVFIQDNRFIIESWSEIPAGDPVLPVSSVMALGGAIHAGGDVLFTDIEGAFNVERNSIAYNLDYWLSNEEDFTGLSLETYAAGGFLYTAGDAVFDEISTVKINNNYIVLTNTISGISDIELHGGSLYADGSLLMSNMADRLAVRYNHISLSTGNPHEVPSSGAFVVTGGAFHVNEGILIDNIGFDPKELEPHESDEMVNISGNSIWLEIDTVDFDLFAAGGAFFTKGSFLMRNIGGDTLIENNTIGIRYHTQKYGNEVSLSAQTLYGGVVYSAGDTVFSDIDGILSLTGNTIISSFQQYGMDYEAGDEASVNIEVNLASSVKGGAIYSGGDLRFHNINHLDISSNGIEFIENSAGSPMAGIQGGALYAAGQMEVSSIGQGLAITGNTITIDADTESSMPSDSLYTVQGSAFHAHGAIVLSDIRSREDEAAVEIDANRMTIDIEGADSSAYVSGGAISTSDSFYLQEITGDVAVRDNGINVDSKSYKYLSRASSSPDSVRVKALGGGMAVERNASLSGVTGNVAIENNSINTSLASVLFFDGDMPASNELELSLESYAGGGAIHAVEDVIFSDIAGEVNLRSNSVFGQNRIELGSGEGLDSYLAEINGTAAGGIIDAGGQVCFTDIRGDISIQNNNLSIESGFEWFDNMENTVVEAGVNLTGKGSAIHAKGDIVFNSATGSIAFENNNVRLFTSIAAEGDSGSLIASTISGSGGALYSESDIVIQNHQGNVLLAENATWADSHASGSEEGDIAADSFAYGRGGAFYSGGSINLNGISEGLEIRNNSSTGMAIAAKTTEDKTSAAAFSAGGALYSGGDISISNVSSGVLIQDNSAIALSNGDAHALGGALYASGQVNFVGNSSDIVFSYNASSLAPDYFDGEALILLSRISGGAVFAEGDVVFSDNNGVIEFSKNSLHSMGILNAAVYSEYLGAAVYSERSVQVGNHAGDLFFGENAIRQAITVSSSIEALASGGAIYAAGGFQINGLINGNVLFRMNESVLRINSDNSEMSGSGKSMGGALSLGGFTAIHHVNGKVFFENNSVIGEITGENVDVELMAAGGAVALQQGGSALFNADQGDIIFRNNKAGYLSTTEFPVNSLGGAIYVEGGDSLNSTVTLGLMAQDGFMIVFRDNDQNVEFESDDEGNYSATASGNANAIHLERNAELHLGGSGMVFLNDPVMSGESGGVSLLKDGSGTTYFATGYNVINGAGLGNEAARINEGVIHLNPDVTLSLEGSDALFTVNRSGKISGSGIFASEGGFVVNGMISPDSREYRLFESLTGNTDSYELWNRGSDVGRLTLEGNVRFNEARLTFEIDMEHGLGDRVIMTGDYFGKGNYIAHQIGDTDRIDPTHKVIVAEAHGTVAGDSSIEGVFDAGEYRFRIVQGANPEGPGTAWWTDYFEEPSTEIEVNLNTAGAMANMWFRQVDNLLKRMGELRMSPASKEKGNVWARTYGLRADIDLKVNGIKGFREYQHGVDLGVDQVFNINDTNKIAAGFFAGYQKADRKFNDPFNSKGDTDATSAGFYSTWLGDDGWYADLVTKMQGFHNAGEAYGNQPSSFRYDTYSFGLSMEAGKQFKLEHNWFVEPSAQISWMHLNGKSYTTSRGLDIRTSSTDALQISALVRGGRTIYLPEKSQAVQLYAKSGLVEECSKGGHVLISDGVWRPNMSGTRAIVGAGVVWQIGSHQIHVDYEANFGSKIDIPWNVNLGYRLSF